METGVIPTMKDFHSKHLLSLLMFICLLAPFVASALEPPRLTPPSRPSSSSVGRPTADHGQVQRTPLKATIQSGYCYANDSVEKSSETLCKRKRGQFFADKREAQRVYDTASGYCCQDGSVSKNSRATCVRAKGTFFIKQNDAQRTCDATKGFCYDEGKILTDSKGSCDRKKGAFFLKKAAAAQFAAQQKGFCCLEGKVSPMIQKMCQQKKGQFFILQNQATLACKNERGFCCVEGRISNLTRSICEQRHGAFSTNRGQLSKECAPKKTRLTNSSVQSPRPTTATIPASVIQEKTAKQPITQNAKKGFDDPIFKPDNSRKGFDDPIFKTPATTPKSFDDPIFKPDSSHKGYDDPVFKPTSNREVQQKKRGGPAAVGALVADSPVTPQITPNVSPPPTDDSEPSLPDSSLSGIKNPLKVVFIKDRMVRIGDETNSNGLGGDLRLKNVQASFLCNAGAAPVSAAMTVANGSSYTGLASQMVGSQVNFPSLTLQEQSKFISSHCRQGEKTVQQSAVITVEMSKTCRMENGAEKQWTNNVDLPMSIICDLLPNADPAEYSPNHPTYNPQMGNTVATRNPADYTLQKPVAEGQTVGAPTLNAPSSQPSVFQTGEADASLQLKYNSALIVDDELRMGTPFQSVYDAQPVSELKSNIELEVGCGAGLFEYANLFIKRNGIYAPLHELNSGGHHNLTNSFLMTKADFVQDHCAAGTMYQDLGRSIEFLIEYGCTYPSGTERFEKIIHSPVRMVTCDRRPSTFANANHTPYMHRCPAGYHIEGKADNIRVDSSSSAFPPKRCIENL